MGINYIGTVPKWEIIRHIVRCYVVDKIHFETIPIEFLSYLLSAYAHFF